MIKKRRYPTASLIFPGVNRFCIRVLTFKKMGTIAKNSVQQYIIDEYYTHNKSGLHIHTPEGSVPKDGPSAGCAFVIAFISRLTNLPIKNDIAMTGEITLRGQILKIGGLKEKLLAAKRGGIKNVIIPKENEADLQEIPEQILKSLNIIPVEWIDEVISHALVTEPTPLNKTSSNIKTKTTRSKKVKPENKQAH